MPLVHQLHFCLLDIPGLCNARRIFHHRVWCCALSLCHVCYACTRCSGIILNPQATLVPNFVSVAPSIAELAHRKNCILNQSLTHSPTLFDVLGPKAFASERQLLVVNCSLTDGQLRFLLMSITGGQQLPNEQLHCSSTSVSGGELFYSRQFHYSWTWLQRFKVQWCQTVTLKSVQCHPGLS